MKEMMNMKFWRSCGLKILSLKFYKCSLSGPLFALEFHFDDLHDLIQKLAVDFSSSIPDNSKNKSLQTLKIHFTHHKLYYETNWIIVFQALFDLFRNITHFSMSEDVLHNCGYNYKILIVNDACRMRPSPIEVIHFLENLCGSKDCNKRQNWRTIEQSFVTRWWALLWIFSSFCTSIIALWPILEWQSRKFYVIGIQVSVRYYALSFAWIFILLLVNFNWKLQTIYS